MEEEKRQVSEYNENALQIIRLNNLWIDYYRYMEAGSYGRVKEKLESIETELLYDAKQLERNNVGKYHTQLKNINDDIEKIPNKLKILEKNDDSIFKEDSRERIYYAFLYNPLRKKARLLKEIQQEAGKGARYKDPDEDEME